MADEIQHWIDRQPPPKPSRSDAIRQLVRVGLDAEREKRPRLSTEAKIARARRKIADNPPADEPSPAAGMSALRRGLAETKLRALKGEKAKSQRKL